MLEALFKTPSRNDVALAERHLFYLQHPIHFSTLDSHPLSLYSSDGIVFFIVKGMVEQSPIKSLTNLLLPHHASDSSFQVYLSSFCLLRHHLQLNLCTFFSLPFWRSVFLSLRILVYPCFTSWDLLKILYHHVLASGYSEFLKFLCVCCWWMSARTCLDAFSWNMISVRKLVSVFCTPNKEGKIKFEAKNRKIRRC